MFNNIFYFIVVLLAYGVGGAERPPIHLLPLHAGLIAGSWLLFAVLCRTGFRTLLTRSLGTNEAVHLPERYHALLAKFSVLAVVLFAVAVHGFHLKGWLHALPFSDRLDVLDYSLALAFFFCCLATIWYWAYPVSEAFMETGIGRRRFIASHLRLNIPILFPWWVLTFIADVTGLLTGSREALFLGGMPGQMLFYTLFLLLLMTIMPVFIQFFWGCRPLEDSPPVQELKSFLSQHGFRYRGLLNWPIFAGRLMTAGVMGIVPRFRYILFTESLLRSLPAEELKAVAAHEMGHVKYKHLLFYLLLFLGFIFLFSSGFEILGYALMAHPYFSPLLHAGEGIDSPLFFILAALPMVVVLLVYFRFVMGFFMRHFERQADLYSARLMGSPWPAINALERIAWLSGRIRDLPSWHHFSIRERVETLQRSTWDRGLVRRHNRLLLISVVLYVMGVGALGTFMHFSGWRDRAALDLLAQVIQEELVEQPDHMELRQSLAMVYHQKGEEAAAMQVYREILERDPGNAVALNNLAWLLLTARDEGIREPSEALRHAQAAVALEPSAVFLDTLAEAYFVHGRLDEAVMTAEKALAAAGPDDDRRYLRRQLERFRAHLERSAKK